MNVREIIEAAIPSKPWCAETRCDDMIAETLAYGEFHEIINPQHALLMEAVIEAAIPVADRLWRTNETPEIPIFSKRLALRNAVRALAEYRDTVDDEIAWRDAHDPGKHNQ